MVARPISAQSRHNRDRPSAILGPCSRISSSNVEWFARGAGCRQTEPSIVTAVGSRRSTYPQNHKSQREKNIKMPTRCGYRLNNESVECLLKVLRSLSRNAVAATLNRSTNRGTANGSKSSVKPESWGNMVKNIRENAWRAV
jgi:hypothetical protein